MKRLGLALAALLILPAWTVKNERTGAPTVVPHIVRMDPGGLIHERGREIAQRRAAGQPVVIDGYCASACTMYLGMPGVCLTPRSSLLFHDAFDPRTRAPIAQGTLYVMSHYPAGLRAYLAQRGFTPGSGVEVTLSYAEAARFVRTCG